MHRLESGTFWDVHMWLAGSMVYIPGWSLKEPTGEGQLSNLRTICRAPEMFRQENGSIPFTKTRKLLYASRMAKLKAEGDSSCLLGT